VSKPEAEIDDAKGFSTIIMSPVKEKNYLVEKVLYFL
jgi:hypothetical protein